MNRYELLLMMDLIRFQIVNVGLGTQRTINKNMQGKTYTAKFERIYDI